MKVLGAIALCSLLFTTTAAHGYRGDYDESPPAFSDKGRMYIGGSFGFLSSGGTSEFEDEEFDLDDTSYLSGAFTFGYFVANGFMLGGTIGFETRGREWVEIGRFDDIHFAPRFYVSLSQSKEAFVFFLASLGYQSVSTELSGDGDKTESSASGVTLSAGAGLAAVIGGPKSGALVDLAVRLRKSFLTRDADEEFDSDVSSDITDIGVSLGIGVFF